MTRFRMFFKFENWRSCKLFISTACWYL